VIELYKRSNLEIPYAKVPITSGSISAERNGYHSLSFSILHQYLEQNNITIGHNTIFKVGGLFYASSDTSNRDGNQIEIGISGELLQIQTLMFKYIDQLELEGTTVNQALLNIISGTIFNIGVCDATGSFDLEITKSNGQHALSELLKKTGMEVVYEGLTIHIRNSNWTENPKVLTKGYDFTTLDENTDVSDVITKLYYSDPSGEITGSVDSAYADKYSFTREGYREFNSDNSSVLRGLANEYLSTVDQPKCSISISIPKIRKLDLKLGEIVKIHNTLLNEEVAYKVVGYTKSLTKEDDIYQLGERKKDFTDIEQIITQEVQEVVQQITQDVIVEVFHTEVISANTAHLLNAWIRDLNVEYLETNFDALDVRKPPPLDNVRNFIRIKEEDMEFVTQSLSTTETMDYQNKDGYQIYYTAINDAPDAYKFFTITSPESIYDDLTPEQVDSFKVKVRKVLTESVKASFNFGMTEGNTQYPLMRWGAGTDDTGTSDKGKGFIYKDLDGLILRYITSTGVTHQIKLGEQGIEGLPVGDIVDIGGLIELPGDALTKATFYNDGMALEHGEIKTDFSWTQDGSGKIISLKNHKTNVTVPVSWKTTAIPK